MDGKKKVSALLVSLALLGCCAQTSAEKARSASKNTAGANTLSKDRLRVLQDGDPEAYSRLRDSYMDRQTPAELLPYALVMSNGHADAQGSYDVCHLLLMLYLDVGVDEADEETATLAIEHLLRAAKLGHSGAKDEVALFEITAGASSNRSQLAALADQPPR